MYSPLNDISKGGRVKPIQTGIQVLPPFGSEGVERTLSKTSVQMTKGIVLHPLTRKYEQNLPTTYKNQPHLLVTCDWLTLRVEDSLKDLEFPDGVLTRGEYRIELLDYGTKFFNKLAKCYYGKDCFAEIQFDARMEVLKDTAFIKYENFIFYDWLYGSTTLAHRLYEGFFSEIGSKLLGITRCDIAVDGVDFDQFINLLAFTDNYEQLKVQNVSPSQYNINTRQFESFTVGKRGGKKYCVYYNKTKEIADRGSKKQYILDYFVANGMDVTTKSVNRFELRLDSEAFKDMQGFEFNADTFFKQESLIRILEFQLRNFFEFVPGENHSTDTRRSRRERIEMFDFQDVERKYVRVKRELLEGQRTAKIIVSRLLRDAYVSEDITDACANFTTAAQMVMNYHLFNWITQRSTLIYYKIEKYASVRGIPPNPVLSGNILKDMDTYSLHYQ